MFLYVGLTLMLGMLAAVIQPDDSIALEQLRVYKVCLLSSILCSMQ